METNNGSRVRLNISKNSRGYSYDFTLEMGSSIASADRLLACRREVEHQARTWKRDLDQMVREFEQDDRRSRERLGQALQKLEAEGQS